MKKKYIFPALDLIEFDINDIISHSLATSDGDYVHSWPESRDESDDDDGTVFFLR